jgi:hypothetical protein
MENITFIIILILGALLIGVFLRFAYEEWQETDDEE